MSNKNKDPYPQIPPALLNSGDIWAYAVHPDVKFIEPFDPKRLKTASYEIACEGKVHAWKSVDSPIGETEKVEVDLTGGNTFTLKPNSIVFICLSAKFKLPNYLAVRFNLTITKVHQGLLLGTGPLVDPGFEGNLLIPLHNLTNQEVVLHADDMLIWVEVTKLSPDQTDALHPAHQFVQTTFPPLKKNLPASAYFKKAHQSKPILSSVQVTLDQSKLINEKLKDLIKKWSLVAAIATVLAGVTLVVGLFQVVQTAHNKFDILTTESASHKQVLDEQAKELELLRREFDALKAPSKIPTTTSTTSKK